MVLRGMLVGSMWAKSQHAECHAVLQRTMPCSHATHHAMPCYPLILQWHAGLACRITMQHAVATHDGFEHGYPRVIALLHQALEFREGPAINHQDAGMPPAGGSVRHVCIDTSSIQHQCYIIRAVGATTVIHGSVAGCCCGHP